MIQLLSLILPCIFDPWIYMLFFFLHIFSLFDFGLFFGGFFFCPFLPGLLFAPKHESSPLMITLLSTRGLLSTFVLSSLKNWVNIVFDDRITLQGNDIER